MWHRLKTGWNLVRIVYLLMGIFVAIQSLQENFWAGVAFGIYFSSMGLFALGCAGGHCAVPKKNDVPKNTKPIEFEEVK
ncbi:MAG: hypothetical protein OHK0045_12190 [Raineya sp.]